MIIDKIQLVRGRDKTTNGTSCFADLPFVHHPKRGIQAASNWHVPPTDDYAQACTLGREYAGHFIQYLKNNPSWVGANGLGRIAADMDFRDDTGAKGYWVGFFSQLERLIHAEARRIDVFADVDYVNAIYAESDTCP